MCLKNQIGHKFTTISSISINIYETLFNFQVDYHDLLP